MIRLLHDAKFWAAFLEGGTTLRTQFGKLGSPGQIRLKSFANAAAAKAALAAAIADKRAEGYATTRADPTKPAAKSPDKRAVARRAALVELATRLGGTGVAKEVALACDDPHAYAAKHSGDDDREVDPDSDNVPWLALVDTLKAKRRLNGLDWKQESVDAVGGIRNLARAGKRALDPLLADEEALEQRPTDEALELAAAALATAGEALLQLDITSDSYQVIVVPSADVAALVKLARTAGESILQFKGKTPAALAKGRVKEKARAKAARADLWGELLEHSTFANAQDVLFDIRTYDGALEKIRAALPFVPAADKPFVQLAVDLNGKQALTVARDAKDARLALRAAQFMMENTPAQVATRLRAIVILVGRLKLSPDPKKDHEIAALALAGYGNDADIARALAALPATDRDLLARLADTLLKTAPKGSDRMGEALGAAKTVGDAATLALLEAGGKRTTTGDRGEAIVAIRARL